MHIQPIQPHQISAVRHLILEVCQELFAASEAEVLAVDDLADLTIDQLSSVYFDQRGTFLVLLEGETAIGSGAVCYWSEEVCELKRLFIRKDYRGRGLGKQMLHQLLAFAKSAGYQTMRLDSFDPIKQAAAIRLYEKMGFYPIDRYSDYTGSVFMEKQL